MRKINTHIWNRELILSLIQMSFLKLDPRTLIYNPVIFVTAAGALLATLETLTNFSSFNIQISLWLWFTVLFANFSEALVEGKGKAQAASLRKGKSTLKAKLIELHTSSRREILVDAEELVKGDHVICRAGDTIPMDGDVVEGVASVDESAITGESAPVIRESGGDRSGVTGGTMVKSDWIIIKITSNRGESVVDKMIALIEGAKRQKTPNEIALSLVLNGLTVVLICVVINLKYFGNYSIQESQKLLSSSLPLPLSLSLPVLASLLVCLIPTTIGGLLSAIGISGMNRLLKSNVIAKSGRAVEAAGDISVLLLDKTGTITYGNRQAYELLPAEGVSLPELAYAAHLASLADETPEGKSIVELCLAISCSYTLPKSNLLLFVPFTAETRMSGIDIKTENLPKQSIRKGALEAILKYADKHGIAQSEEVRKQARRVSEQGGTPLVVVNDQKTLGVIHLKDIVKEGIKEKFAELRKIGIKTIMITGDNPLTAASIAKEAGVDDYIAEATPEDKLKKIREEQKKGHMVAMTGDGTNDAPALAQADVGLAMNMGTQAAKEAGNMVDLDSDPTKLMNVVEVGKQLLMTRGALTTFSFANDIAKYFAILPAMFAAVYATSNSTPFGPLSIMNIMQLSSPESSILSAVIFNALIIVALTPLALKGVQYQNLPTELLLKKNLLLYGVGGVVAPFVGIKLIDLFITTIGLI
ncbi:MAG: potassium-transporting ATPase subunit KdpB [Oligoflexia bacterium]|nr:potassium-transporting ATPase subunit KdpB [Oligoflexia bacterium]